jgi:hypothetical protein
MCCMIRGSKGGPCDPGQEFVRRSWREDGAGVTRSADAAKGNGRKGRDTGGGIPRRQLMGEGLAAGGPSAGKSGCGRRQSVACCPP